ncbi:Rieske (2Fe-2S) protein [Actinokineospora sp. NBRC 105648]|uniref:Rieske (2Fe-2S) protein n=1 Tax=Actinokineospora sp. NBRC 105648 TaxID=3032206 RepID=UPI00249FE354|nr:Rieske (2Fe-2S) protein [Actinokineospora sp. NBRC 105648]GLZ36919.1 hypothetical protein Acsp05_05440 [Actinokineospora sp. NBRC 105648]
MTVVDPTTRPAAVHEPEARSRRQVLCGLMVALVAPGALVAACGDSGSSNGSAGTTTGGAAGTTGGATTGGSTGGSTGGTTGALSTLSAIPDGGGVLVDNPSGGKVLLVRAGSTVKGFDPTCPHQGATVDPPKDGVITCPRHFSTFDASTGDRKSGQAQTGLKTIAVKVSGDNVVLG